MKLAACLEEWMMVMEVVPFFEGIGEKSED